MLVSHKVAHSLSTNASTAHYLLVGIPVNELLYLASGLLGLGVDGRFSGQ